MVNKASRSLERRQLSKNLRHSQTPAEEVLWKLLRAQRLDGLKFRRQHPIGQFIADFYCPELRLAIELDGGVHKKSLEQDKAREEAITRNNIRVVRLKNEEILNKSEDAVRKRIRRLTLDPSPRNMAREGTTPHPSPLHVTWRGERPLQEESDKRGLRSPSLRHVEREGAARERRECELCGRAIRANQPVLVIANGKVHTDKKALALKSAQFTCHASCWNQIENEDI